MILQGPIQLCSTDCEAIDLEQKGKGLHRKMKKKKTKGVKSVKMERDLKQEGEWLTSSFCLLRVSRKQVQNMAEVRKR